MILCHHCSGCIHCYEVQPLPLCQMAFDPKRKGVSSHPPQQKSHLVRCDIFMLETSSFLNLSTRDLAPFKKQGFSQLLQFESCHKKNIPFYVRCQIRSCSVNALDTYFSFRHILLKNVKCTLIISNFCLHLIIDAIIDIMIQLSTLWPSSNVHCFWLIQVFQWLTN